MLKCVLFFVFFSVFLDTQWQKIPHDRKTPWWRRWGRPVRGRRGLSGESCRGTRWCGPWGAQWWRSQWWTEPLQVLQAVQGARHSSHAMEKPLLGILQYSSLSAQLWFGVQRCRKVCETSTVTVSVDFLLGLLGGGSSHFWSGLKRNAKISSHLFSWGDGVVWDRVQNGKLSNLTFSYLVVWIIMKKKRKSMNKYLYLRSSAPVLFSKI